MSAAEVLLGAEDWVAWQRDLAGLDVVWVRVDCAVEIAEARERARGDRLVGMARAQLGVVHAQPVYDLSVDSGTVDRTYAAPPWSPPCAGCREVTAYRQRSFRPVNGHSEMLELVASLPGSC